MADNGNLDKFAKCRDCVSYDPTPYPEYNGKLAKCRNPKKDYIGAGVIGFYTLASSVCYERRADNG